MAGRRIEVRGTVQGVGFRPWVCRLARDLGVRGTVRNEPRGVTIEAFGEEGLLDQFYGQLQEDIPPTASLLELRSESISGDPPEGFRIAQSGIAGDRAFCIPPDLATCAECEREISDPGDRRFRYAFTNCTGCGPRFTIATGIPYDRSATTMAAFEMCAECQREYDDLEDRRFHAQPNACPRCGPSLSLVGLTVSVNSSLDPIVRAASLLNEGAIVAVKGLGGFHLACDATNASAVSLLRLRKHRDEKPFAVMVRNLDDVRSLVEVSAAEEKLLCSPERPIVLLRAHPGIELAAGVSPETPLLGLFLPYTPLHHLLLEAAGRPLVMTSANIADEPICASNEEAVNRLEGIADAILLHDRKIATRCDDSVVRVIAGVPTIMRRSRGFVPRPFQLKRALERPVLACGAHLKNTFCIAAGDLAYLGPHIGDLETLAALDFFEEAVERMQNILSIRPEVIAHDLHPGYESTRYALRRTEVQRVGVQHHHAHLASLMAEHGVRGPVLGVAYDGTGFGDDETAWGAEFLLGFEDRFERLASFRPLRLAGGDLAMREVWRIGYALVHDAFDGDPPIDSLGLFRDLPAESLRVVSQMIEREIHAPKARGLGRYFDAFAAIVLERPTSSYEGQLAVAWDHLARDAAQGGYPYAWDRQTTPMEVDLRPAVRAAVEDLMSGAHAGDISGRFHRTIIDATVEVVEALQAEIGPVPVGLTGGVFHNQRLAAGIEHELSSKFNVLRHGQIPPGDGGIALGQALIADAFLGDKG